MANLNQIVAEQWSEDVTFEIKEALPLSNGAKGWAATSKLHASERDGIAKEVVAFANTRGGILVVGIEESDYAPKRAQRLATEIPNVAELADRLSQALNASIDPPLRGLQVQAIPVTGPAGFLVIKVPLSNLAPHGFGTPALSYVRKQDRSEPMSMSEPPRVYRRLLFLRDWSHDRAEKTGAVFA
ncbi:MAG: helix-turn-helix domain-containing protein [Hyphomonas sp.]